jgi:hypothetical protein
MPTCIRTYVHTYIYVYIYIYIMPTYIDTYIHTYIHTYIRACRHSRHIVDVNPISVSQYQSTCALCKKHRGECTCTCHVCLDEPVHVCHFLCAIPTVTHAPGTNLGANRGLTNDHGGHSPHLRNFGDLHSSRLALSSTSTTSFAFANSSVATESLSVPTNHRKRAGFFLFR